jgi:Acetyltransferase (GNAT) domain
MKVRHLGRATRDVWIDIARRCPYATYFHTPAWAEIMVFLYPQLSAVAELFELRDGVPAVIPLLEYPTARLFRGYESMVPGVYGGPIAERSLRDDEVDAIIDSLVSPRTTNVRIVGNPHLECFRSAPDSASDFVHMIDLHPGFDEIFRNFHENHRYSYRTAVRKGLTLHRAESLQEFREYFEVYQADRRRWGAGALSDYPVRLFEEFHRRADPNTVLWLAKLDGRVIAGDLWLYWGKRNVGWLGAIDPAFVKFNATNFVLTEIIRDACARGDSVFDMAASSGLPGLIRFKDSFGAKRVYFRERHRAASATFRAFTRARRLLSNLSAKLRRSRLRRPGIVGAAAESNRPGTPTRS